MLCKYFLTSFKRLEAGLSNHESLSWLLCEGWQWNGVRLLCEGWQWNGVSVGMTAVHFGVECLVCVHGDNHKKNTR